MERLHKYISAGVLRMPQNTCWYVFNSDSTVCCVNMLTASSTRPKCVNLQIFWIDLDVNL